MAGSKRTASAGGRNYSSGGLSDAERTKGHHCRCAGRLADLHAAPRALQDGAAAFLEIATSFGLQGLSKYLERDDALPEHILIPLAKAITLLRMLAHNGALAAADDQEEPREVLRSDLVEWCLQAQGIVTSLDWVVMGTERKLKSRRWSRPESLGW